VRSVTTENPYRTEAADVARDASRYLDVPEVFASLDADPHASARARAAHARRAEDRVTHTTQPRTRKAVNRWRS
jgi:hypothetical protein